MKLSVIDITIVFAYLISTIFIGWWVSKKASENIQNYFLGGNSLPWYVLGISNASGMFDIAGTMLLVYLMTVYGLKSIWLPWLWPVFNQIFLMVYLSVWLRRSNAMTGADWIKTRFGTGKGATLSHIIVVIFALLGVIGMLSYGFKGIGKFAATFLPSLVSSQMTVMHPQLNANLWALILMVITTFYVVKGGMFSVVITEVLQYCILTIASIAIGVIAINKVSPQMLSHVLPAGWKNIFFGWSMDIDWRTVKAVTSTKVSAFQDWIMNKDGYTMFGLFFIMMLFKGIFVSAAGPAPNYDMQRILSTKSPKEAAKMSSLVSIVLNPPRYFMIAGITILALTNFDSLYTAGVNSSPDFESILPQVMKTYIPVGLLGLLLAGLFAAFMSNFAATVNAAPAYIVNDIYKRYINPNADNKRYVNLSYIASIVIVIIGIGFGFMVTSINEVMLWITAALWGGYVVSNILKWYWWRFNGYGYFWGMVAGVGSSILISFFQNLSYIISLIKGVEITSVHHYNILEFLNNWPLSSNPSMNAFPIIFLASIIGCLLGTLLTKPEDEQTLKTFYINVRPWGFWKPVHAMVIAEDPTFQANKDFSRDMFNIIIGIIWQINLMALPVYLIIREKTALIISITLLIVTSVILKFTWWNKLKD